LKLNLSTKSKHSKGQHVIANPSSRHEQPGKPVLMQLAESLRLGGLA
jgi:hypothetical protein